MQNYLRLMFKRLAFSDKSTMKQLVQSDGSKRVVGGNESIPFLYPWIAFLITKKNGGKLYKCGGALLTDR